ncbi:MAG: YfhO family protein [Bacteroidales bacterium]|nr:YfhO family protein [Candidatus Cacconaster merdequi]
MNPSTFFKKYGAYVAAAVLFIVLAYAYCKSELSGKIIQSGDDINAISSIHEAMVHDSSEGEYGFWNGSVFSGMPNYQIGGGHYRSEDLIKPFISFFHRGPAHPAWIMIFYFVCFFILLRSFKIDKWLSITGAIAIALSSYFLVIIAAGHGGKTIAISYMSLVIAGFYLTFRKRYGIGAIFTMFFTSMGFSIHPQMSYYLFMMIGLLFIAELWIHLKEKRYRDLVLATVIFALSLGIGLGTRSSNIFANKEYMEQTMRGGHSDLAGAEDADNESTKGLDIEYATQWSYGIDETFSLMIPGFKGGASSCPVSKDSDLYRTLVSNGVPQRSAADFCQNVPMYWGEQPFTAGNVYVGAIVCFLFVLGLMIVKGPYKWALLASTLFSITLAWGSNFMWLTELFFNHFPLYNKFRAVSSILIVAEIAMPLLGFLAIKAIMDGALDRKLIEKRILLSGGITAGLCLCFALFGGIIMDFVSPYDAQFAGQIPDWLYSAIVSQRADLFRSDSWRSFIFIALAVLLMFLFNKGKLKARWMIPLLGVLILADMWPVDKRYFNDSCFINPSAGQNSFKMQPYEEAILQDPDPHFRVMNLTVNTFNESRTSYYLKSIGGYHAAKLRRYQDLIDEHLSKMHLPVIGMLNAKYLIIPDESGEPSVQLNPYALGNAWFVDSLVIAGNANEEMDALNRINLANTAVLEESFSNFAAQAQQGHDEAAEIHLEKYSPRAIDYSYTASKPGTVVFSEIYYPYGWEASIDGEKAEHFRVNYILRALNVPEGSHTVHFEFAPDSVRKGDTLATICILLMYAVSLSIIACAIIKKRRKEVGV